LKKVIKKFIRFLIPQSIKNIINEPYMSELQESRNQTVCYSQEGEDLILETFFHGIKNGLYVDIGSYHPKLYSNTYLFYLKGWRGINIDARPGSKSLFDVARPKDINIETAVGTSTVPLKYFMFDEPGLNGFSEDLSKDREANTNYKIINTIQLSISSLEKILDVYLPQATSIDFMSIDVEGFDYDVLQSNNWQKYKPKIILVETSVTDAYDQLNSPISKFLGEMGYSLVAKTYRTSFYKL